MTEVKEQLQEIIDAGIAQGLHTHSLSTADTQRRFASHSHSISEPGHSHGISAPAPAPAEALTRIVTVSIRLDAADFVRDMQRTIADSLGIPAHMLFGEQEPCSAEARRLMTVAAFPHTPE